jgi:hypothetical protein
MHIQPPGPSPMEARVKTLDLTATVEENGRLIVRLPPDIPPGEHRVVLVIDEQPISQEKRPVLDFPVIHVDAWPEALSLRREDLYDERGR